MKSSQVKIGFTGDIMLGRLVNEYFRDCEYLWGDVLPILQETCFNIANLENAFTNRGEAVPKTFNFRVDPLLAECLKTANIAAVNLANNHVLDFGEEGFKDTIDALDEAGISHAGVGFNIEEARAPAIIHKGGLRIAFLGATDNEPGWAASDGMGINFVSPEDLTSLKEEVKKARKEADLVIASLHWGPNMRERPAEVHIKAKRALIEVGTDVIHGHSAHVFQVEKYKNGLILHDLGDFVDDYAVDSDHRNNWSFFFIVTPEKLEIIPIVISEMQVNLARGAEKEEIVSRMKRLSEEFGTVLKETERGLELDWHR